MPEALNTTSVWIIAPAFALGGLAYLVLEAIIAHMGRGKLAAPGKTGMWMIYAAVTVDLFSDGLMIGAGATVSSALAVALALGQVLADVPEGFATIANFRDKDVPRARRLSLTASLAVPVLVAASLAFFLLRGQHEDLKAGALVFTAGLLIVAAVEDMMAEAHEAAGNTRTSVFAFIAGFTVFTLVSGGLAETGTS